MDDRNSPRPEAIARPGAVPSVLTRRGVLGAAVFAVAALAAGCGGSSQQGATSRSVPSTEGGLPPATAGPAAPGVANGALPSIVVNDVAAGTKVDLSTVGPVGKPLLVWFWAPH